jgi:hypothetical protein
MKRSILIALTIAFVSLGLSAQTTLSKTDKIPTLDGAVSSGEYQFTGSYGNMKLSATLGSDDTLYLAVEAPTSGWVGIGVGGRIMNGSRLFLGAVQSGKAAFIEKAGVGHFYTDAKELVVKKWAVKTVGADTVLELSIPSSSAIWKGQISLICAYSNSPSFDAMHRAKASLSLSVQ